MNQRPIDEQQHFEETMALLRENQGLLAEQITELKGRLLQLQQEGRPSDKNFHNLLVISQNQLKRYQENLEKHQAALECPYFGRVDFRDLNEHSQETLYIGKHGISRNQEIIIVDWRSPAAAVYYENEMGHGFYSVPDCSPVEIDLMGKRTYSIVQGEFQGYYDNDIAASDDLLVSYLSRNREAASSDIIATIQKEQNLIIRQTPFKNILIQGAAGSGKTTVAMHHLSYLLYNYGKYIQPEECCILTDSRLLLTFISRGLPELEIASIKTSPMKDFFVDLLGKHWKKKYRTVAQKPDSSVKARLPFAMELRCFLDRIWNAQLAPEDISDPELGLLLSASNQEGTLELNRSQSAAQVCRLINQRVLSQLASMLHEHKEWLKEKKALFCNYRKPDQKLGDIVQVYLDFLEGCTGTWPALAHTAGTVREGQFDVYDLAALAYIHRRLTTTSDFDQYRQLIIDEAQDLGESVYYILKEIMDNCHFTVMGDVSQNIQDQTGLEHWEDLKQIFLTRKEDSFYLLSKSYRNTIEIARTAARVLAKTASGRYPVEPVIRHGKEPEFVSGNRETMLEACRQAVRASMAAGYRTMAIICRHEAEADWLRRHFLQKEAALLGQAEAADCQVTVVSVELSKGLEFDMVVLWQAGDVEYPDDAFHARLLYVGMTRAMHQLLFLHEGALSPLLGVVLGVGTSAEASISVTAPRHPR